MTDGNGVARFENVLIGTGYVLEEVDTPVRYVVPDSQTATIEWNEVTHKSVNNVLKKFRVTVTKSDVETGAPQGDGSLAGATYGLYKGDTLIDSYTTDENGQFTTGYYVCDSDWTIPVSYTHLDVYKRQKPSMMRSTVGFLLMAYSSLQPSRMIARCV